jgi:putative oxidoreductase
MWMQLDSYLDNRRAWGPVLLRLALGSVFVAHAYAKAALFTFAGTEQFFEANGFPGVLAYPVFAAELVGGLALLRGYRVRLVSLLLVPVMLGALKPHLANGWMFTNTGGGYEYVLFLLVALLGQALMGAGSWERQAFGARVPSASDLPRVPHLQ